MIRTRDLTLTKGALYRWSYGSTRARFTITGIGLQVTGTQRKLPKFYSVNPCMSPMCQHTLRGAKNTQGRFSPRFFKLSYSFNSVFDSSGYCFASVQKWSNWCAASLIKRLIIEPFKYPCLQIYRTKIPRSLTQELEVKSARKHEALNKPPRL